MSDIIELGQYLFVKRNDGNWSMVDNAAEEQVVGVITEDGWFHVPGEINFLSMTDLEVAHEFMRKNL